ncbi:aminotransferase class I/II-fold pyridoxal phosphate-dependent enzyme [Aquimarina sp. MMG016]|uniref:pyridoxal phosphate-dependent decarboxylase family protein n=1 Tax=Aquimarina sp. MMG016 TaxID=2822690 RepID=UPI001B3A1562|nr:aminotransferase class I/II-fold pyridoxal phosphate-dependent enzyme [Aquimarina sp. MMG016]MBQ4819244.1 aminotransferase class I/II-fold pyridoxal phosphate-dependent enzyme [Aquimarina sp. MMG016]
MKDLVARKNILEKAYDPSDFRAIGHQMIDLLSDHLERVQVDQDHPVLPYQDPEDMLSYWQKDFSSDSDIADVFQKIVKNSISVHHPRYIGHQVAVPAFISSLAGLISDLLSNGTGVYEMGMAANAIEKIVTDLVANKIGYTNEASGVLTSGGSLANLTALLAARKAKAPTAVWENGHQEKLAVMVSEESHYCIDRAARILGLGEEGIIKVPVDKSFKINTLLLDEYLQKAQSEGLHIIAIIGCASSTATGSYDDLNTLADFAEQNDLWFHVDGAHGAGVVFSEKYKHLADGISRADSVVIDFHKMLMTPALNTGLIFKKAEDAYKTFEQKAQYLWDSQHTKEWYNSGKRTFECTKLMMSIKVYAILKTYGEEIFEQNIDTLYGLASVFAQMVKERTNFELALTPEANIINFRYINSDRKNLSTLNAAIRQTLITSGKFYIVQTRIDDELYLRTTIMNPLTKEEDLLALLDEIERIAISLD